MLNTLNQVLQKWMPILTPISLVVGVFLEDVGSHLLFVVPWLFAFMTFASSLSMKFNDVKVFKQYHKTILFSIAFLHIIMPLWAYFLSNLLFDDHLLIIGFIISVAVPTGVTSVIWVNICRGHMALCLSIILIDTLLSPVIMPLLLHVVVGEEIAINTTALVFDLIWMIVLPSLVGMLLNEITKGKIQQAIGAKLAPFSKLCLFGVIMINSSSIAPFMKNLTGELLSVIVVVLLLAVSGYTIALLIGAFIFKNKMVSTTFVFIGGMRNITVGVVIATTYFPAKVAMPVVFGMLFQQVLASLFSKVIDKYQSKWQLPTVYKI